MVCGAWLGLLAARWVPGSEGDVGSFGVTLRPGVACDRVKAALDRESRPSSTPRADVAPMIRSAAPRIPAPAMGRGLTPRRPDALGALAEIFVGLPPPEARLSSRGVAR